MIFQKGHNFVKQAKENGSMEIADQLLSANHLLMCISSEIMQQVDDVMERNQLKAGPLKKAWNNYQKSCDVYMNLFSPLVADSGKGNDMRRDLQTATELFRKWAVITNEDIEKISARYKAIRDNLK